MYVIVNNPFRVAGVLANTTERELQKQKTRIKAYTKVGREVESDFDFQVLPGITRTEESVNEAFSKIEQNQDRVSSGLFWFLNESPFDNTAIEYLKNGDDPKAKEIWEKITAGKEVSSKNFSAFNNLGTLKLLSKDDQDLKEGIELKIKLIESAHFENYVQAVADETFTINGQKQVELFIDAVLDNLPARLTGSDAMSLFTGLAGFSWQYVTSKFTEAPIHRIEGQVESGKKKRKASKLQAYEYGLKLYTSTKDDLALLKDLIGTDDLKYKAIADQLANEILQCGIDYFNESQKNNASGNYLESAEKLNKLAATIAVGSLTKDRAKDSLATLADMKDGEIKRAIQILKSIEDAYKQGCREIDKQVEELIYGPSTGGLRLNIPRLDVSIDYAKVNEAKRTCLNWDKVIEVIKENISPDDIEKIQKCPSAEKVSEYKRLVNFLITKLGPIQLNRVKYLCYWKDLRAEQAKSTANKVGKTIGKAADSGCYIATMAYGDYDHPQVMELRKFRDEFLSKTILGRQFIALYYNLSPSLVRLLKNNAKANEMIRKGLDQFIKSIKKV